MNCRKSLLTVVKRCVKFPFFTDSLQGPFVNFCSAKWTEKNKTKQKTTKRTETRKRKAKQQIALCTSPRSTKLCFCISKLMKVTPDGKTYSLKYLKSLFLFPFDFNWRIESAHVYHGLESPILPYLSCPCIGLLNTCFIFSLSYQQQPWPGSNYWVRWSMMSCENRIQ